MHDDYQQVKLWALCSMSGIVGYLLSEKSMVKNILTHWRTSLPGFTTLVTSVVSLGAMILSHTATQAGVTACVIGIFTGLGLLFSQDYTVGAKAHAESQAQIAQLQERSNIVPNAIESGDTSQLRKVPITPASITPPVVDVKPAIVVTLPKP